MCAHLLLCFLAFICGLHASEQITQQEAVFIDDWGLGWTLVPSAGAGQEQSGPGNYSPDRSESFLVVENNQELVIAHRRGFDLRPYRSFTCLINRVAPGLEADLVLVDAAGHQTGLRLVVQAVDRTMAYLDFDLRAIAAEFDRSTCRELRLRFRGRSGRNVRPVAVDRLIWRQVMRWHYEDADVAVAIESYNGIWQMPHIAVPGETWARTGQSIAVLGGERVILPIPGLEDAPCLMTAVEDRADSARIKLRIERPLRAIAVFTTRRPMADAGPLNAPGWALLGADSSGGVRAIYFEQVVDAGPLLVPRSPHDFMDGPQIFFLPPHQVITIPTDTVPSAGRVAASLPPPAQTVPTRTRAVPVTPTRPIPVTVPETRAPARSPARSPARTPSVSHNQPATSVAQPSVVPQRPAAPARAPAPARHQGSPRQSPAELTTERVQVIQQRGIDPLFFSAALGGVIIMIVLIFLWRSSQRDAEALERVADVRSGRSTTSRLRVGSETSGMRVHSEGGTGRISRTRRDSVSGSPRNATGRISRNGRESGSGVRVGGGGSTSFRRRTGRGSR